MNFKNRRINKLFHYGVKFVSTKLCIMTAYADETLALLNILGQDVGGSVDWNSRLQFEGVDGNKQWVVMQSGMGKVRAASMCQMIIDTYQADTFYEFGFAGGLVDTLNIGDIVVITGVSEHDGPNRSEIQREQDEWRARLFQASASSINTFANTLSTNPNVTLTKAPVICGDMDVYNREVRDQIAVESGAVAVNWESSAIVDVCALNNVKYVGVRIISDLCVEEDSGPIPKARIERLHESTKAYVNALVDFNKHREILSDAV